WYLFFFQAEDGIRDFHVTGVQTCALPISPHLVPTLCVATHYEGHQYAFPRRAWERGPEQAPSGPVHPDIRMPELAQVRGMQAARSEERRVGKEGRSRW